jgi:membrane protein DedA with SNARE-associated domain
MVCVDFFIHTIQHISPLYIYILVASMLLLESSGIPIVNTTLLLFTGAMAALGHLDFWWLLLASISGSVIGACSAYLLGSGCGEAILFRLARLLRIDRQKVVLAERWFQRSGARMIFISRIVPYIRPFACFPAGIAEMPFPRFLLAAASGSILWCVTFLLIGWEVGPRWKMALHLVHASTIPTICALLVLILAFFFIRHAVMRYMKRQLSTDGEEAARDRDLLEV